VAVAAMWFCGRSTLTSASRVIYALARDKGLQMATLWGRTKVKHRTPGAAIWLAERVGFEPTCPLLAGKTLSRRPRYDRFGTSPRYIEIRNLKLVLLGGTSIAAASLRLRPANCNLSAPLKETAQQCGALARENA
jgi:hypothetical protein